MPAGAQVVIARVISIENDTRRLRLSLAPKTGNPEATAGDSANALQPGDLVEGAVASITSKEVSLRADAARHTIPCCLPPISCWARSGNSVCGLTEALLISLKVLWQSVVHRAPLLGI